MIVCTINFVISGSVSEKLASLTIGGESINVNEDLSFESEIKALSTGNFGLSIVGIDLAGNTINYELPLVFDLILVPNLISIESIENGDKLLVVGMAGSTKPNTNISIVPGFFGTESTVSDAAGAFSVEVKPFSSAKIKASNGSQEVEDTLTYAIRTRIAGMVKNIDGQSLPGVKVRVSGSNVEATTDVSGSFSIDLPPTGDRQLIIDASVLNTDFIKYSNVEVGVNVSYNRNNILEEPIFLAPLVIDGSETLITESGGTIIQNSNVPGVEIAIQSGTKATFPNGELRGVASISKSPSAMTVVPVPEFAVAKEVIHLEPSGLVFDKPRLPTF